MPIALSIIDDNFIKLYEDMPEDVINIPYGDFKIYGQNAYGRFGYFAMIVDNNLNHTRIERFFDFVSDLTPSSHCTFLVVGTRNDIINSIYENYDIRINVDNIPNLICYTYLENKTIFYICNNFHSFSITFGSKMSGEDIMDFIEYYVSP